MIRPTSTMQPLPVRPVDGARTAASPAHPRQAPAPVRGQAAAGVRALAQHGTMQPLPVVDPT